MFVMQPEGWRAPFPERPVALDPDRPDREQAERGLECRTGSREGSALSRFWQALVHGEFSFAGAHAVASHYQVVAQAGPGCRAPTDSESRLLRRGFLAEPQKVVAAELGVSESTVSVLVGRALRKLGFERRLAAVPLPIVLCALDHYEVIKIAGASLYRIDSGGQGLLVARLPVLRVDLLAELTPAEREVARLFAAGLSHKTIAHKRGTSSSTVANQLASTFRKLNAWGRLALIRYWACLQWPVNSYSSTAAPKGRSQP